MVYKPIDKVQLESKVEGYYRNRIRYLAKRNPFNFIDEKFEISAGMPDRILIVHNKVYFIEFKRPNAKLRKLQHERRTELLSLGQNYVLISSSKEVDEFLNKLLKEVVY